MNKPHGLVEMHHPQATAGVIAGAPTPNLTYHGGPVIHAVQVIPIYWGAFWAQPNGVALSTQVNAFFDSVLVGSYLEMLREYSSPSTTIGLGNRLPSHTISGNEPGVATAAGRKVTDPQIQTAISGWIAANTVPAPTANTLYFVYLPPNCVSISGNQQSCTNFCGYHNHFGANTYYAVEPFITCGGCNFGSILESLTKVSSHELAEAITDPALSAWFDPISGSENGDICNSKTASLGGFLVQPEWSNSEGACVVKSRWTDPLPGASIVDHTWQTIRAGHNLIQLPNNRIMDWEPATGHVRIWHYDPNVTGSGDPLPGVPIVDHIWQTIRTGHQLILLSANRILDWEPATGHARIWNYDSNVTGAGDPLPGAPVVDHIWQTIRTGHKLFVLPNNRVMDWEVAAGRVRIWHYDPNVAGSGDPLPGNPIVNHVWQTIRAGHELVVVAPDKILDWEPATGHSRMWRYDASVTGAGDPLPGKPVIEWIWDSIRSGHQLILLGTDRVLDFVPATGNARIWHLKTS